MRRSLNVRRDPRAYTRTSGVRRDHREREHVPAMNAMNDLERHNSPYIALFHGIR